MHYTLYKHDALNYRNVTPQSQKYLKSHPYFVKFPSGIRPNPIVFNSLCGCKILFSYDEKCGEIRYTGVKFFSVDEKWTDFSAAVRCFGWKKIKVTIRHSIKISQFIYIEDKKTPRHPRDLRKVCIFAMFQKTYSNECFNADKTVFCIA